MDKIYDALETVDTLGIGPMIGVGVGVGVGRLVRAPAAWLPDGRLFTFRSSA